MKASDNPSLDKLSCDPTVVCTGYKKNRFYLFSRREPDQDNRYDEIYYIYDTKLPCRREKLLKIPRGRWIVLIIKKTIEEWAFLGCKWKNIENDTLIHWLFL